MIIFKNIAFFVFAKGRILSYKLNGFLLNLKGIYYGYCIESNAMTNSINKIYIGRKSYIQRRCTFSLGPNGKIVIGAGTRIGSDAILASQKQIWIGENVLIAARVYIGDSNHKSSDSTLPIMYQGTTEPENIHIGSGSWLGVNVSILPGVKLGENCIVGANSVVTRSFSDGATIAGIPARIIQLW